MINKLKPLVVALGLGLALTSFSASAGVNWSYTNVTRFQDDDIDFLIDTVIVDRTGDGVADAGWLDVGDTLLAVFELGVANGVDILPDELTGVTAFTLAAIGDVDGDGFADDFSFEPNADFEATFGPGAMMAFYLDSTPNLNIESSQLPGPLSCTTMDECIAQATDGVLWEVDGFNGDPDEFWISRNAEANTNVVLAGDPSLGFGDFNAGLSILFNGTGVILAEDSISCFPFCTPGGNGLVDASLGGAIKGGAGLAATLIADGAKATSDFDFVKRTVPEPSTIALLGMGLFAFGANARKRKA